MVWDFEHMLLNSGCFKRQNGPIQSIFLLTSLGTISYKVWLKSAFNPAQPVLTYQIFDVGTDPKLTWDAAKWS